MCLQDTQVKTKKKNFLTIKNLRALTIISVFFPFKKKNPSNKTLSKNGALIKVFKRNHFKLTIPSNGKY